MDQDVIEIARKDLLRRILLWILTTAGNTKSIFWVQELFIQHQLQTVLHMLGSSIPHQCPQPVQEAGELTDCDKLCHLTDEADETEGYNTDFDGYTMFERDVHVAGNMRNAEIIGTTFGTITKDNDEEEPCEIPISSEMRELLHLLHGIVLCSGGDKSQWDAWSNSKYAFLAPSMNT